MTYSDPIKRLQAYLIDIAVFYVVMLGVGVVVIIIGVILTNILNGAITNIIAITYLIFIPLWYFYVFAYYPSRHNGQTMGAKKMKIKVMYEDGKNVCALILLIRILLSEVSIRFFIPHLLVFSTPRKQALHDIIFHTVVIDV